MKAELKYGLLFNALAIIVSRFAFLPNFVSDFICGAFVAFGLFLMVVSLLPQNIYDKLYYRQLITNKG